MADAENTLFIVIVLRNITGFITLSFFGSSTYVDNSKEVFFHIFYY